VTEAELPGGFVAALGDLSSWLDAAGVPYVVIGGASVSLLAQPRATQDIDITVWLDEDRRQDFFDAAGKFNFEPRLPDALAFAATSRVLLLLRHRESGVSLDVSLGSPGQS
jgi:hypothetical protein